MIYEKILLPMPEGMDNAEIIAYLPENTDQIDPDRLRKTVIVCAGGGYRFRSDREAEPVVMQLLAAGFNAFLMQYHLPVDSPKYTFPTPQLELAAAIAHIRKNAAKYHALEDGIVVMGFSAGGHLACSVGLMYDDPVIYARLGVAPQDIRPDGMLLSYPVITGGEYTHADSLRRLLATDDPAEWEKYSLEDRVHPGVPPAFIWATYEDELVPLENTLFLANALRKCGVNMELHIFPHGQHGLSLNTPEVYGPGVMTVKPSNLNFKIGCWMDMAIRWIREL